MPNLELTDCDDHSSKLAVGTLAGVDVYHRVFVRKTTWGSSVTFLQLC